MKETIALLIVGHLLGDYAFQNAWIARNKRWLPVLILHVAIVAVMTGAAVGHWNHPVLWIVVGSHFVIDLAKSWLLPDTLGTFVIDQLLHLAAVAAAAVWFPHAFETGYWWTLLPEAGDRLWLLRGATVLGGIVLCIQTGAIVVAKTVRPLLDGEQFEEMKGVPGGGRMIGYLERGLTLLLFWIGQPAGIGFLVTAKSILRFGDITGSRNRQITEYVIIGTFLSFGWAILTAALMGEAWKLWD